MTKLRVILADPLPIVRVGLRALLNSQQDMEVVGEATEGDDAVRTALERLPDIAVLAIALPGLSGIEAARRIFEQTQRTKVLIFTQFPDKHYLRQALEAGAAGFALKSAPTEELLHALRTIAGGGTYIDPALASQVIARRNGQSLHEALERCRLSDREEEVLKRIAAGLSNKEIAARLALSTKTVETYKTRSMKKLDLHSRADIVRHAMQQGWLEQEAALQGVSAEYDPGFAHAFSRLRKLL